MGGRTTPPLPQPPRMIIPPPPPHGMLHMYHHQPPFNVPVPIQPHLVPVHHPDLASKKSDRRDKNDQATTDTGASVSIDGLPEEDIQKIVDQTMHIHGLAHAASGYHRVLEENRKLYNQVQDLKGRIRVYCRIATLKAALARKEAESQQKKIWHTKYGK